MHHCVVEHRQRARARARRWSSAWSTATRSSSSIAGRDEPVRLIGIDTPETRRPAHARSQCFGPEASAARRELLPPGTVVRLERDVEARDRYDRLLAYVFRAADGLFVNLVLARGRLRRRRSPSRRTSPTPSEFRAAAAAAAPGRHWACGAPAATPDGADRAAGSVGAVTSLAERLGYRPDDRLLIINCDDLGVVPRRQRRHLRGPARRRRHQRHADGAVPLGPRGRRPVPRRGRRRAPHAQRRVRAATAGARSPTRRRCSTATAASRARSTDVWDHADLDEVRRELPGPGRAGDPVGLRRQPPRQPHGHAAAAPRVLRRLPRPRRRVRAAAPPLGASRPSATIGFPFRRLAAEEGVLFPDHFVPAQRRAAARTIERVLADLRAGRHRGVRPPGVDTPELRALSPHWAARVDDHALVVHDDALGEAIARTGVHLHRVPPAPQRAARPPDAPSPGGLVAAVAVAVARDGRARPRAATTPTSPAAPTSPTRSRTSVATVTVDVVGLDPATVEVTAGRRRDAHERRRRAASHRGRSTARSTRARSSPGDSTLVVLAEPGDRGVRGRARPRANRRGAR